MGGQALKFKIEELTLPTGRQGFKIWAVSNCLRCKILLTNDLMTNDLLANDLMANDL
jgi:hypothetical protein